MAVGSGGARLRHSARLVHCRHHARLPRRCSAVGGAGYWCCTREQRALAARMREMRRLHSDRLERAQAEADMNRLNQLFEDDIIPAELQPMTDAGMHHEPEGRDAFSFHTPSPANGHPRPTSFHLVQRDMIAAAANFDAPPVRLTLAYLVQATRGYALGLDLRTTRCRRCDAICAAVHDDNVRESFRHLGPCGRDALPLSSFSSDDDDALPLANTARILGYAKLKLPGTDPTSWPFAPSRRRLTALCMETFPPSSSLSALLSATGNRLAPELVRNILTGVISGLEALDDLRLGAIVTAECIAMQDGLLSGQSNLTTLIARGAGYTHAVTAQVMELCNRLRLAGGQTPIALAPWATEDDKDGAVHSDGDTFAALRLTLGLPPRAAPDDDPNALEDRSSSKKVAKASRRLALARRFAEGVDDVSCHVKLECALCGVAVHSSGRHMRGVVCSHTSQHFFCRDCVNSRISALLTDAAVDMDVELPCPMGCPGLWVFDDFGALVRPQYLRRWHKLSVERARIQALQAAKEHLERVREDLEAATRDREVSIVREHIMTIRKLLRPACPHCALPFESFRGCLSVTCGARDRDGRQVSGCGKVFCGGCMAVIPCPMNCGHSFVQPAELQRRWRAWRMLRVVDYLGTQFAKGTMASVGVPGSVGDGCGGGELLLERVIQGVKNDLEIVVGIWPLSDTTADS